MSVNQRVSKFINLVTVTEILSKTELGKTALYRARSGGGVNADTLEAICFAYPKLNAEWILRGIGEMWVSDFVFTENSEKAELDKEDIEKRLYLLEQAVEAMKAKK